MGARARLFDTNAGLARRAIASFCLFLTLFAMFTLMGPDMIAADETVQLRLEADISQRAAQQAENAAAEIRMKLEAEDIAARVDLTANTAIKVSIKDPSQVEGALDAIDPYIGRTKIKQVADPKPHFDVAVNGGEITLTLSDHVRQTLTETAVEQSLEVIRKRASALGLKDPDVRSGGDKIITLVVPVGSDVEEIGKVLTKPAVMTFHLVDYSKTPEEAEEKGVPEGSRLLTYADRDEGESRTYVLVFEEVAIDGSEFLNAYAQLDQQGRGWVVAFQFHAEGAKKFATITEDNVGRQFAVVLDGEVITAPRINGPITGGSGIIEGGFTVDTARELALLLRSGALPVPLTVIEERADE